MFERFTHSARQVVMLAKQEAEARRHSHVGTDHLLLAIMALPESPAAQILASFGLSRERIKADVEALWGTSGRLSDADALAVIGIDLDEVRRRTEEAFGPGALERTRAGRCRLGPGARFAPRAKKVLELSLREALNLRHNWIGTEHILLALLRESGGLAARVLGDHGVTHEAARAAIRARPERAAGA